MIKKAMKKSIKALLVLSIVCIGSTAFVGIVIAQETYPREYTNPDEIVAFDKSTNYAEAIEVINQFVQEYRNKFIIDQTGTAGTIGINLPAMHWEDALTYILRFKGLGKIENDDYIEILPESELITPEESLVTTESANASDSPFNLTTREIRINATFFEGNKRALQEVGIDWSTLTNNVPANLNEIVAGEGGGAELGVPQTVDYDDQFVSVNSYNASSVSQNVFNALVNLGELGPGIRVQALFSAFEADNLGEVIATPSVKVVDGQEGRIQVGQDFSIKQRDIAGNVTDEFFSTGTILTVTPTVISTNDTTFIHVDIAVERSSAQPDAVSTIINKQQASTQALLLNGESTSIAGLYRSEESKVRRGIPILKDLPPWFFGLRYLFGYNSDDYVENELIILIQAELEKTLEERLEDRFQSKRELMADIRTGYREDLDRVFDNPLARDSSSMYNEIPEDTLRDEDYKPLETPEEELDTPREEDSNPSDIDSTTVETPSGMDNKDDGELSPEQEQIAKELSLPVDNPELMVVVPRAFSLDEYLQIKETGEEVEPVDEEELRFFIIGGSFLVKNNANRFNTTLQENGYDTRVLFHPESRFNFVAYKGFNNFDVAVSYLKDIKDEVNSEAWLFRRQ